MRRSSRSGRAVFTLPGPAPLLALAAVIVMLSACSGSDAPGPLVSAVTPEGLVSCVPAPNPPDISNWYTPIGFALDIYYNNSHAPLTIESVSLLDPHGLVLHGARIYEMVHDEHPLIQETAWNRDPAGEVVPGAVMPAENSTVNQPGPHGRNVYQLVLDITATTPHGGWAIGEQVRYRAGGQTYDVTTYTGYAIGAPPASARNFCMAQINAVDHAWSKLPS